MKTRKIINLASIFVGFVTLLTLISLYPVKVAILGVSAVAYYLTK